MRQGYYRYEHKYMSRNGNKTRGASAHGHLAKASNYYANDNKCVSIRHVNLTSDRHALWHLLNDHDRTITRKNGRIAETPQFCFDNRMSREHMIEAADRFNWRVSFQGQIKVVSFIHLNDANNPHAHAIIIDVGKNGAAVGHFGRSASYRREHSEVKGNLVEWFRRVWEEECNSVLMEHGYDIRIDRRTNLERGLEPPGQHRGHDEIEPIPEMVANDNVHPPANDNADPETVPQHAPSTMVEPEYDEPIPEEPEAEDADAGEVPMPTFAQKLHYAQRELRELRLLDTKKREAVRLQREYSYWTERAEKTREKADLASQAHGAAIEARKLAEMEYKRTHLFGMNFGLKVSVWPPKVGVTGKKDAIRTEKVRDDAIYSEARWAADFREANAAANIATQKVAQLEGSIKAMDERVQNLEHSIDLHQRINGTIQDFDSAEEFLLNVLGSDVSGLRPEQVLDAYEREELSADDCSAILQHLGHPDLIPLIGGEAPSVKH